MIEMGQTRLMYLLPPQKSIKLKELCPIMINPMSGCVYSYCRKKITLYVNMDTFKWLL